VKAYCGHCRQTVTPIERTTRCEICKRHIWEMLATEPGEYRHKLRTTNETYRECFEHGAKDDTKGTE